MSDPSPPRRRWWKLILLFLGSALVGLALLAWYITTPTFQQALRRRLVAALEEATGGRVELGDFHTTPLKLRVEVRNLTIHGRESEDQIPYLHVDRVAARLRIIALFRKELGLRSLIVDRLVMHIIVYPDGTTNAPQAKIVTEYSQKDPVEQLFELSSSYIDVRHSDLLWEDNKIPLDFAAKDFSLNLRRVFLAQHYETRVAVGGTTTRFRDYPVIAAKGDASFLLFRDHAEVEALNASTERSQIHFSGKLQDFHHPAITGAFHGVADAAEFGPWVKPIDIRRGVISFEGKGFWKFNDFAAEGTLRATDLDYSEQRIKLERARLESNFSITPSRLHLSSIRAAMLGGELSGDVDVINWQSSEIAQTRHERKREIGRIPAEAMQRGTARVEVTRFPLAPGLAIISSEKLPLDRMRFNGAVSGTLEMLWVGSIRDSEARMNLKISPPARAIVGEIPLRGQMRGVYRGTSDELRVDEFRLNTPASEVTAKGDVASTSNFKFSFSSHDMSEWQPLLRSAMGEEPPFSIHGFAVLNGTANGRLTAFQFNGRLEAYDFDTLLPGDLQNPNRTIHWDSLTAGLQYSNQAIAARNATLIHGSTIAHFDASTALTEGQAARNAPFTLHFDARHADLAEIATLAGSKYPVKGVADLTMTASGTPSSPHGDGHVDISNASVQGVPITSAHIDLRLSGGELLLNNLNAAIQGATLTGSAAFNPDAKTFRANLAAKNVDLATIPQLQRPRLKTEGHADITFTGSGTKEHPSGNAQIHVRDLTLDNERAGDFYLDAQTQGQLIAIEGRSDFTLAKLNIKGTLNPGGDMPADFDVAFDQLDADSILRLYLGKEVTGHAIMAGNVSLHGPLRSPRDIKLLLNVSSIEAEVEHVPLRNTEPIRIELADQTVRVESFHIQGAGTDLTAHGTALLGQTRALDLRLDGTANVALLPLPLLNPSLSARGMVSVNVGLTGNLANPVLEGKLDIKDASFNYDDLPTGLSELNGTLLFDQNRLQIQSLSGKTGGGQVQLTGSAYIQNGLVNFDVGAQAQDIRLRYPPGVSATATANLQLTGNSSSAMVSGDVLVTKLAVMPGFDFGAYLERSKLQVTSLNSDTVESHVHLDVHITTTPELQMQTAIARLSGDADLHLRGTVDRPVVTGRAGRLEGEVYFNGTRFRVDRGEIAFTNPAHTQPFIDLQASTRVRDYDITINVAGDASKGSKGVNVTWRSEPPLPEADIIALLAMGRTREEAAALAGQGSAGFSGEFSNMLIGEAINSTVGSRVQRLFGVSRLKIDPQGLLSTTNVVRGPQITVEQQVTSNVTITYSTNVSVASQQIIQLEYNITRNVSIVALRDQNGVVSFDIKIRQRKR